MSETTADERKLPWRDSRTTVIRYRNAATARLSRSRKQTKVSNAIAMLANKHCAAVRQNPWVRFCFIELLHSGRIACRTSDRRLKVEINTQVKSRPKTALDGFHSAYSSFIMVIAHMRLEKLRQGDLNLLIAVHLDSLGGFLGLKSPEAFHRSRQ